MNRLMSKVSGGTCGHTEGSRLIVEEDVGRAGLCKKD